MIEFRLLGSVELRSATGVAVVDVLRQPKRTALLAYLAVARPFGFHRRDELLALFWPEADETHARGALNQATRFLRRSLPPGILVSRGAEEIGLATDAMWSDVQAFTALLDAADVRKAMDLYRGDLLTGFHLEGCYEFGRWLDDERQYLRRRAAAGCWLLAEMCNGNGREAAAWAQRATLLSRDEASLRRLIEILDASGDAVEAIRSYDDFTREFKGEYGIEPSRKTIELVESIRRRGAQPAPLDRHAGDSGGRMPVVADAHVIAVLPFDNLTGDDYRMQCIIDGLHAELIAQLSRMPALRVISRTSVMSYRNSGRRIRDIAVDLSAGTVLETTVRGGVELQIDVRLIDGRTDLCMWSATFDATESELLAFQCAVARSVAEALGAEMSRQQQLMVNRPRTRTRAAYAEVLLGRHYWHHFDQVALEKARDHFRNAIALDSSYADAYAGLAAVYAMMGIAHSDMSSALAFAQVKRFAAKALSLDDQLADAYAWLGYHELYYGWNWSEARRNLELALQLNPSHAVTHSHLGFYFSWQGQHEQAIASAERAILLDPVSPITYGDAAVQYYYARRYGEAAARFRQSLELKPDFHPSHWGIGETYLAMGDVVRGIEHLEHAARNSGNTAAFVGVLAFGYSIAGRVREARQLLDALLPMSDSNSEVTGVVAAVYAGLGDVENTDVWLRRALEARCVYLPHFLTIPVLQPFIGEVTLAALRQRVGLPLLSGGLPVAMQAD